MKSNISGQLVFSRTNIHKIFVNIATSCSQTGQQVKAPPRGRRRRNPLGHRQYIITVDSFIHDKSKMPRRVRVMCARAEVTTRYGNFRNTRRRKKRNESDKADISLLPTSSCQFTQLIIYGKFSAFHRRTYAEQYVCTHPWMGQINHLKTFQPTCSKRIFFDEKGKRFS